MMRRTLFAALAGGALLLAAGAPCNLLLACQWVEGGRWQAVALLGRCMCEPQHG